uniref:Uncharacterized protein n=1 Tax=Daphnia galeata TaxID=27404 RepID=A0A8J2RL83_9CRUS|nr:unnamed protein product [Daphnia galeata]
MDLRQKVLDLLTLTKEGGDLPTLVSLSVQEQLGLSTIEIRNLDRDSSHVNQNVCPDPDSQQEVFDTIEAGKQTHCADELSKVLELQENLDTALETCSNGTDSNIIKQETI